MFGQICHIDGKKNFGFIRANGTRQEFFFHAGELIDLTFDECLLNERVEFDPRTGDRGLAASRVRPVQF